MEQHFAQKICDFCDNKPATVRCDECEECYCMGCDIGVHKKVRVSHIRSNILIKMTCELCQDKPATVRCDECDESYCLKCDKNIHKKARAGHIRQDIDKESPTMQNSTRLANLEAELQTLRLQRVSETAAHEADLVHQRNIIQQIRQERDKLIQENSKRIADLEEQLQSLGLERANENAAHEADLDHQRNIIQHIRNEKEQLNQKISSVMRTKLWHSNTFAKVKEEYLQYPLDKKRILYKYAENYVTLHTVKTWQDYQKENTATMKVVELSDQRIEKILLSEKYKASEALNKKVSLWRGDITCLEIDAIVNAANSKLLGGDGVDGAIHTATGYYLLEECMSLGGCKTGDARITGGYNLPAKYVIHTVGPIVQSKVNVDATHKLESTYKKSLQLMLATKLQSIAFPCISTGCYGYPPELAAPTAVKTVRIFLEENIDSVDRIIFCVFSPEDLMIYQQIMPLYFPAE